MAQSKSTYLRAKIYKAIHNQVPYVPDANLYMSFHTAAPGLTGLNEVVGNAYARQLIVFGADTGGTGTNSNSPAFPAPAPGNWGTITHFGIWNQAVGGDFLGGDALLTGIITTAGIAIIFPAGSITWAEL